LTSAALQVAKKEYNIAIIFTSFYESANKKFLILSDRMESNHILYLNIFYVVDFLEKSGKKFKI
jgi:hypothetical protein